MSTRRKKQAGDIIAPAITPEQAPGIQTESKGASPVEQTSNPPQQEPPESKPVVQWDNPRPELQSITETEESDASDSTDYLKKSAQQHYNEQIAAGKSALSDILLANNARIKEAEQANLAQAQAEQERSIYTGAGELAAGLINLIGVGNGASNQVYHSYSIDWQRKADQDARERRARIDNLKARRDAIEQQMQQLAMRRKEQADARNFQAEQAEAAREFNAAENEKNREAANTRHQQSLDAAAQNAEAARKANAAEKDRNYRVTLARYGLTEDNRGRIVKAGTAGGGKSRNTFYYRGANGGYTPVAMTDKEYNEFINQAYAVLSGREDLNKKGKPKALNDFAVKYNSTRATSGQNAANGYVWDIATQDPELVEWLNKYRTGNAKNDNEMDTKADNSEVEVSDSEYDAYK